MAMSTAIKRALTVGESDLAVNFYDVACDHRSEVFGQIVSRVLGPRGFSMLPHPETFRRECQKMFDLARSK